MVIAGNTRALVLPDFQADDPLAKRAGIAGYVAPPRFARRIVR